MGIFKLAKRNEVRGDAAEHQEQNIVSNMIRTSSRWINVSELLYIRD